MDNWAKTTLDAVICKYEKSAARAAAQNIIPYSSEGDHWTSAPFEGDAWWTGGFWTGLMWQLYTATGTPIFQSEALRVEKRLVMELCNFEKLHHDVGFMYLLSCGAHWLLQKDGDAKRNLLHAAALLAGRFNLAGQYIRAWNEDKTGWAIIDSMMNLNLLFWASRETKDPRFRQIAIAHADTAIREFVRADGSCHHIVIFDPDTGMVLQKPAGQGYAEGSSWSRGQAWALYGFTLAYLHTKIPRFLETACRIADYFINHIRPDGLIDCDFRQPPQQKRRDDIAAACAACALIELSCINQDDAMIVYANAANRMLQALNTHSADYSDQTAGILQNCTAAYWDQGAGTHVNIVYGDYFYVEAIAKLQGIDPMFWMCQQP